MISRIPAPSPITRRRALQQTFFFSAALALARGSRSVFAEEVAGADTHFLMVGDWGAGDQKAQRAVAQGMEGYARKLGIRPEGLFFVGDNFYGSLKGGIDSPRWQTTFEEVYPASVFPGPCWAMFGNHDYDEEKGTKIAAQLGYAPAHRGTRWTMPAKWYRVDWPAANPLLTCLVLDSNWKNRNLSLTADERASQMTWLKAELEKPRRTPWLVAMAHHPFYSNGPHGDHAHLIEEWGPLFQKHGVDFYFCGHDHDLQHFEFEGSKTSFVVSGGGGARLYTLKVADRGYAESVYGFTHLQVNREKFIVRHLDPNQKVLHAFSKTLDGKVKVLT